MDIEQKKTLMMDINIFNHLTSEEYDVVAQRIGYMKIKKGDTLIREGSLGNSLFYMISGSIEIKKESLDGKQALLSQFSRGSIIGEQALLMAEGRRSATAVALEDCELLTLSRKDFDDMIEGYPRVGVAILRGVGIMMAERLSNTSGRFADLL